MPMPPPKPSAEAYSDPRTRAEVKQLTRALRAHGPVTSERLGELVGAAYWDRGRFDEVLVLGLAEGRLVRDTDGRLAAP